MKIKIGFEIAFDAPQPTPMVILLNIHPSRQADLLTPDQESRRVLRCRIRPTTIVLATNVAVFSFRPVEPN